MCIRDSSKEVPESVPKKGLYRDGHHQNPLGGFWWYRWFWCFWWFWRSLALKFGFYEKFHRQNWLEIVGKQKYVKN